MLWLFFPSAQGLRRWHDGETIWFSICSTIINISSKDLTISSQVSARPHLPKIKDSCQKLSYLLLWWIVYWLNLLVSEANPIAISVRDRLAPECTTFTDRLWRFLGCTESWVDFSPTFLLESKKQGRNCWRKYDI